MLGRIQCGMMSIALHRQSIEPLPTSVHESDAHAILWNLVRDSWVNEELGKHRGREGKKECVLCESVCHVCPADFLQKLQECLGDSYLHFEAMNSSDKPH